MSARYLRRDGLRVRLVTSPEHALAELTGGRHAAAVIDLTMPGLDPRRIRRALRTPVVFLVADPKGPRPRGLAVRGDAAGARRWLVRPFSPRQLVALVRDLLAVSARAGDLLELPGSGGTHPPGPKVPPRLAPAGRSVGALRLDVTRRILAVDGRRVPLTATECAVLAVMMDNPGRVQSRRQLLAAAGRQAAGDRAADVLIAQLRAKIGQVSAIRTVRRAGYALDP